MTDRNEVLIVGGGIIGAATAYILQGQGLSVQILEEEHVGAGASTVAAGMLAPYSEFFEFERKSGERSEEKRRSLLLEIFIAALNQFGEIDQRLVEETGIDIGLRRSGSIRLAFDEPTLNRLQAAVDRWRKKDCAGADSANIEIVSAGEVRRLVSGVSDDVCGGIYAEGESHVMAERLLKALALGAELRGAVIREGIAAEGLLVDGGRVVGVRHREGKSYADHTVVAAGAWTAELFRELELDLPVKPVRGQILSLDDFPESEDRPQPILFGEKGYVLRKADGMMTVGATVEEAGFDRRVTAGGLRFLLELARELIPDLDNATFRGARAGLRPGTPDGFPLIGRPTELPGLLVATGHFRNGILLSLLTGRLISWQIAGGGDPPLRSTLVEALDPARFWSGEEMGEEAGATSG